MVKLSLCFALSWFSWTLWGFGWFGIFTDRFICNFLWQLHVCKQPSNCGELSGKERDPNSFTVYKALLYPLTAHSSVIDADKIFNVFSVSLPLNQLSWSESCQCRTIIYKASLLIVSVSFDPHVSTLSHSECVMDHQNKSPWIPIWDKIWFEFRFVLSGSKTFFIL